MPKFFAEHKNITEHNIILTGDDAKHISVLRYQPGESVVVCDGAGTDYDCNILDISSGRVVLAIQSSSPSTSEPQTKITLFQGLPKSDKMELIIQKCVELGVYEIVPVVTEHTIVKLNEKSSKKTQRWQKISESAAKQSGRGIIPEIKEAIGFQKALEKLEKLDGSFVAYEKESCYNSNEVIKKFMGEQIGIFIGPEGGFSLEEIQRCISSGVQPISLGRRILRTETAGFTAIIILLFVREEL